jgi:hypothetical protein
VLLWNRSPRDHEAIIVKTSLPSLGTFLLLLAHLASCSGAELPNTIDLAPCQSAPTIDGAIGTDEWRAAPVLAVQLFMIRIDPPANETRPCKLRVINSANALYVALKVPDQTVDNSLSPLMLDAAILGF